MKHLQRLYPHGALAAQGVETVEKMFAGQLVAKDQQLQRTPFPVLADGERRGQDDFIDGCVKRIFGGLDIVAVGADRFCLAAEVFEEGCDPVHETLFIAGRRTMLEHEQHIKTFMHQVQQGAAGLARGACVGRGAAPAQQRWRGASFDELAHAVTAISSSCRSRMPAGIYTQIDCALSICSYSTPRFSIAK